eukprot:SAG31_NODE_9709_length_1239_cov_0.933333_1_plen_29_part_10
MSYESADLSSDIFIRVGGGEDPESKKADA